MLNVTSIALQFKYALPSRGVSPPSFFMQGGFLPPGSYTPGMYYSYVFVAASFHIHMVYIHGSKYLY